jgi:hypothetical protein
MNKKTQNWCIDNMLNTVHCQELLDYLGYEEWDTNETLPHLKEISKFHEVKNRELQSEINDLTLKSFDLETFKYKIEKAFIIIDELDINKVSKQGALSVLKLVLNEFQEDKEILNSFVQCEHCNTIKKCRSEKSCYIEFKNKNEH